MLVYHLVLTAIALIFFLFLNWLRRFFSGLSLKLIIIQVSWVYLVSSLLPGLMSLVSPMLALSGALFLVFLGSYLIFMVSGEAGELPTEKLPEKVSAEEECALPEILPPSVRKVALQEYMPAAVAFMLPKEILIVPKGFMHQPTWKIEQLFLPVESVKIQNEEAVLLSEKNLDFRKLIDDAFKAKDEKNFSLAVNIFKAALSQATDISIKSMIYTEFIFIYKEMGKYLEAAGLIEGFLLENGSFLLPSLRLHFEKMVQYLLTLDGLLKKAEHTDLPFSQASHLIKIRAEKIFQNQV